MTNIRNLKVGQEITLVSKGIRHSDYGGKDWVDPTQKGRTSFFMISKVGLKYLHGTYIYWDGDGRHDRDWPSKVIAEDYIIYSGIHQYFKARYEEYYKAIQEWDKAKERKQRELHSEWYDFERKQMDKWREEHPYPQISISKDAHLNG